MGENVAIPKEYMLSHPEYYKEIFNTNINRILWYSLVDDIEEYKTLCDVGYEKFNHDKFVNILVENGYCKSLSEIVYVRFKEESNLNISVRPFLNKVKALHEQGVSNDMAVYILMTQ